MKKLIISALVMSMLMSSANMALAGEMRTTFDDAMWGGLTGALVGGAILLFQDKPEDHLEYIAYGFGAGVIVGAAYNLSRPRYAMAEVKDGKLAMSIPDISTKIVLAENNRKSIQVSADLLRVSF